MAVEKYKNAGSESCAVEGLQFVLFDADCMFDVFFSHGMGASRKLLQ